MNRMNRLIFMVVCIWVVTAMSITDSDATEVIVEPVNEANVLVGQEFTVNINISEGEDVSGYEFDLFFSPSVVEAVSAIEQDYLKSVGVTAFGVAAIDNTGGAVRGITCRLTDGNLKSGSGPAVSIIFKAKDMGSSVLRLGQPKLYGANQRLKGEVLGINSNFSITNTPPVADDETVNSPPGGQAHPGNSGPPASVKTYEEGTGQTRVTGPAAWTMFLRDLQSRLQEITKNSSFMLVLGGLLIILVIFIAYRTRN